MSRTLPTHANLRHLRLQAKDLLKASQAHEAGALQRLRQALPRLRGASDADVISAGCTLQDIQFVIAHEYGFDDWSHLRSHLDAVGSDAGPIAGLAAAFEAVQTGALSALQRLLLADVELVHRRQEPMGNTLLHTAASKAEPEVVKYLIRAGAALNTRAGEGWTPLHNAAGSNRVQAIELLLDAGADAGLEACGDGGTALAHALFYGHQEAAQLLASYALLPANLRVFAGLGRLDLLPALFDQEGTLSPAAYAGRGFYRHHGEYPEWTPSATAQEVLDEALVYASQNRQQEALSFLLDHGANASGMPYYASALHAAAYNGDVAMIDLLLLSGADPSVRDGMHGGTPADWAVHGTSPDVADRLLQPQTETETVPEPTTLFDLIEQGLQVQVQERLAQGADVHAIRSIPWEISGAGVTDLTQNLLQACASAGRPGIGALLAAAGAAVDLHAAAFLGDHQAVQMYIDGGQAVDDVDAFGMTALHRAIQGDSESTVDLLLRQGADVHHSADTYTFGARALHVAAASGASRQVIERLIEAGGDVSHAANPGTPMQIAQRASRGSTVMILRDLLGSS